MSTRRSGSFLMQYIASTMFECSKSVPRLLSFIVAVFSDKFAKMSRCRVHQTLEVVQGFCDSTDSSLSLIEADSYLKASVYSTIRAQHIQNGDILCRVRFESFRVLFFC